MFKISYILNNLFQLYRYFWTQLFFLSRPWFMDKIVTVLGYKNFITEMSYTPDCQVRTCFNQHTCTGPSAYQVYEIC